jgi:SLT domain-containing protein
MPLANLLDKNSDKFTKLGENIVKAGGTIGIALTPAFNAISKTVGPIISSVVDTVSKNLPVIVSYFKTVWTNIKPYLQEFAQTIKDHVIPVVMDIWNKVKDVMPGVKDLFKAAFEVAVDAIKIAIKAFDWVAPKIQTMWDIISPVLNLVIDIFNNVASAIKSAVDWLNNWNGTKAEVKTPSFSNKPGEYNFINGTKNGEGQYNFVTGKKDILDNGAGAAAEGYNFLTGTKNGEKHGYDFITGKAYASCTDFAVGGLSLVGELGPELVNLPKGAQVINNKNTVNMLKGNNMAAQFAKTGEDIPTNLAKGIKKTSPSLMDAMSTTTQDLIQNFGTGITDNSKYPIKSTNELTKNVSGIFTTLGQQSNPLGQSLSQGLAQGMQDSESNATEVAKTLTDKVIETFKTGFDIHSPSRKTYAIGLHTIQGFVNGLASKDLKGFVDKHVKTVLGAFGAAVNVPGGVSEWLTQALVATGTPLSWLPGLQRLVMAESGGDPNNWNPQGVGGEHATGLLQTLPSTFQEFMQKGMNNIQNPVDNAAAAINYIKSRYGDVYNTPLFKGGSYVGYADGTSYATPGMHWVGEKGPELMKFNGGEQVTNNKESMKLADGKPFIIQKLADQIIVREDADIDKIATALAKKLALAEANMI